MPLAFGSRPSSGKPGTAPRAVRRRPARAMCRVGSAAGSGTLALGPALGRSSTALTTKAKLEIGRPNDRFEQEADRVADQVMRTADPQVTGAIDLDGEAARNGIQRVCAECEEEVRRQPLEDEDEQLQMKRASGATPEIGAGLQVQIGAWGGGQPLSASMRAFFEPRFGHDFSRVRLHTDQRAADSARTMNALAYTVGSNIVFGSGQFSTATSAGRRLLAHELTHTVQQGATLPTRGLAAASAVESGATPTLCSGLVIQRACRSTPPPPDLDCPTAADVPGPEKSLNYGVDDSGIRLPPGELEKIAAAWHAGGGLSVLRIDAFTSCEGSAKANWDLSCKAALAAAAALRAPADGSPPVPESHIEMFAHGQTDQFSSNASSNRRVVITSDGVPAPGGLCGLGVTGPSEVDHYCAAYVPSDVPACGVFPAPNITLTAVGVARGGTPAWRILRGGAMASIAGANTGASVDIHGDAASQNPGDVAVQVTNGTCTTMHALTVREPSEMTAVQARYAPTRTHVETLVTYTVLDQFKKPMGADICVDETMTLCFASHPAKQGFGDSPTNPQGQVEDQLALSNRGGIPADMCRKFDQVITAGGCGPLLHNTIVYQASGVTLNPNDSCPAPGSCP
jgi:Domain of unknown function (DUF4157)